MPKTSVIISMYNNAEALLLSLAGYEVQTEKDFEIIIADDGSNPANQQLLNDYLSNTTLNILHAPIKDDGFQKCRALNHAVKQSSADYLVFTDADIIPRRDFIQKHLQHSKPGFFITGGSHINTEENSPAYLTVDAIKSNSCFTKEFWVKNQHLSKKMKSRFEVSGIREILLNLITWRTKAFNGSNASCWKEDFKKVNGFDEDFGYGGLDVDFGLRLSNAGVKSRRYTFSLIALHQWHTRPYRDPAKVKENKKRMRLEHKQGRCVVKNGFSKHF